MRLVAVNAAAAAEGCAPGMTLATARALVPRLAAAPADPRGDARALAALADWCRRFTPWAATDGEDGAMLDVTGCAHLFGGEDRLLDRLLAALARFRLAARAGLADTPAAAWALARFGGGGTGDRSCVPPGGGRAALLPLPVAALRLPAAVVAELARLGLVRVGDLAALPRAPLAARFGEGVLARLDAALGLAPSPISPRLEVHPWVARHAWPHPVAEAAVVEATLARLIAGLMAELAEAGLGIRRLRLGLVRVDGGFARLTVGAARPTCDPGHFARLFALRFEGLDLGLGVEAMVLAGEGAGPLGTVQRELGAPRPPAEELPRLLDRLAARLGEGALRRLAPVESHVPERAVRAVPATAVLPAPDPDPAPAALRPLRLLAPPEPIEAVAVLPDSPPLLFRWRGRVHRIARAEGPERIAAEWWRRRATSADDVRDYYRVEDRDGGRYWLYRRGPYRPGREPRWFLHGLFA